MASIVSAERYQRDEAWRPRGTRWLATSLARVDQLFDRVYGSRYNPLYRTGTLAALFLTIALITGVYLLFVYEIGRPYESMVGIQNDVFLGRWIRALHRYVSDAAVIAVVLHVARLLVQGKTWGPRTLAWITGVLLTGMMFLSAFTGFVLVWDVFGQKVAMVGARMLRLLPLFVEPPDRSFVGDRPIPSQFFFMNLFLHVAIPLGMICFLWLHTSKLARAAWFPDRRVVWGTLAGFAALALVWPAPLPPAADLLAVPGRASSDWFYAFWIPLADWSSGAGVFGLTIAGCLLLAIPWLVRPARVRRSAPAVADPEKCEGCRQCFLDCPYDAIRMVTGNHPEKHPLRADVLPDLCVSCGLCAASCASLAIGPPARTAWHQLAWARDLVASTPDARASTLVLACRNNDGIADRLRAWYREPQRVPRARRVYEWCDAAESSLCVDVDCAGTLHPGTVSYLATHFEGVVISSCPPQNCVHRKGATLADARILLERRPAVPGRIRGQRVEIVHHALGEWSGLVKALETFDSDTRARTDAGAAPPRTLAVLAFSAIVLGLVALGSRWPQGADADHAVLRLGWRLANQARESCRDLTADELAQRPVHMRTPRECKSQALTYELTTLVDGRVVVDKKVKPAGLRGDRPLTVEEDVRIAPGDHHVKVTFAPEDAGHGGTALASPARGDKALVLDRRIRFDGARLVLISIQDDDFVVIR